MSNLWFHFLPKTPEKMRYLTSGMVIGGRLSNPALVCPSLKTACLESCSQLNLELGFGSVIVLNRFFISVEMVMFPGKHKFLPTYLVFCSCKIFGVLILKLSKAVLPTKTSKSVSPREKISILLQYPIPLKTSGAQYSAEPTTVLAAEPSVLADPKSPKTGRKPGGLLDALRKILAGFMSLWIID